MATMRPASPGGLRQFVWFGMVGALNTGFSYCIYAVAVWSGLHYAPANFVAMLCGTVFSFLTQGRLVFDSRDPRRFGRYLLAWVLIWALNVALIHVLVRWSELDAYLAGALALGPTVALSFLIQKYFVFARHPSDR